MNAVLPEAMSACLRAMADVQQNHIRSLADLDGANFSTKADGFRAVFGRHPEYLRCTDWLLVDAGMRMQMFDQPHFL